VGSSGVTDSDRVASEDACAEVAGGSMYGEWPAAADGSSRIDAAKVAMSRSAGSLGRPSLSTAENPWPRSAVDSEVDLLMRVVSPSTVSDLIVPVGSVRSVRVGTTLTMRQGGVTAPNMLVVPAGHSMTAAPARSVAVPSWVNLALG
jgi:hypothetical protein